MKMKKINAALGLLSIAAMLVHIGYTVFAYLKFYYNESLKILTAIPFIHYDSSVMPYFNYSLTAILF